MCIGRVGRKRNPEGTASRALKLLNLVAMRRKNAAFTLVELLVVIGIIAVLIGILLPTLSKSREQSRRTGCMSNLRSLSQAMFMYSERFHGRLPNGNPPGRWTHSEVLIWFANDYVCAPRVFHCPSDRDPEPDAIWTSEYMWPNSAHVSYDFYSVWWPPEYGPVLTRLRGRAPLAWDLSGAAAYYHAQNKLFFQNHGAAGGNVAYADGHVEWLQASKWERENWPSPATQYYPPGVGVVVPRPGGL
jgi:prepilin-type N-terminal cleavage/methylation domain-containing protein/prepilin-type processing-associated H-X9-DG protein